LKCIINFYYAFHNITNNNFLYKKLLL
jgi:hypothetical protein